MWRKRDRDLQREIETHLDLEAEEQRAAGRSPEDAARAARRTLGSIAKIAEDAREVWGGMWLARIGQDLGYAVRLMRRGPIVTTIAVVSLGLGIGANSATFSAFDALLMKTLPVASPAELVDFGMTLTSSQSRPLTHWNYQEFAQLRDGLPGASDVAAISESDRSNLQLDGAITDPGPVHVSLVSGRYFSLFGVAAREGRLLTPADDGAPGGHPVAVISDAYMHREFAGTTGVVGHSLKLNDTIYDIVGVASPSFVGDWVGHPTDVWIPIAMQSQVMIERPGLLTTHGPGWIRIVARMRPGLTVQRMNEAANVALGATDLPVGASGGAALPRASVQGVAVRSLARGYSEEREQLGAPMVVVVALVGLVLLIACANVASLQLVRATGRRAEMAIRSALGASRGRLIRQALTEGLLLATCAGGLGLGLAVAGMRVLERLVGSGTTNLTLALRLDSRVLVLTSATTLGTAVVLGLTLARAAWGTSLSSAFARRSDAGAGTQDRFRLTKVLVVAQVALSLILLVGASLFIRTLRNLQTQPLGLDRAHILLVETAPRQQGAIGAGVGALMGRLTDELRQLPGVQTAAASTFAPLGGAGSGARATVPGYVYRADEDGFVRTNSVTPHYFETMGMTLLAGRDFGSLDSQGAARVAVINEAMARYYWQTPNAVGKRFGLGRDTGNEIEVVGVVRDARIEALRDAPEPTAFLPYQQTVGQLRSLAVEVRTGRPEDLMRSDIRDRLHAVAPSLPVVSLRTVDENVARMLWTERLVASLSALFGGLALLLTCLGLYALMAYVAVRRTNEIGIRMALGASRLGTMWLVVREGVWQVGVGLLVGVPSALVLVRLTQSLLFGVTASDVVTIGESAGILVVVAALASSLPAYRAARVDPVTALRAD